MRKMGPKELLIEVLDKREGWIMAFRLEVPQRLPWRDRFEMRDVVLLRLKREGRKVKLVRIKRENKKPLTAIQAADEAERLARLHRAFVTSIREHVLDQHLSLVALLEIERFGILNQKEKEELNRILETSWRWG